MVTLINFLQQQPDWESTAVIVAYDDSDGWADHAFSPTTHPSFSATADALNGAGICGVIGTTEPAGVHGLPVHGRCGPGTRTPFLVISPFAKQNYVSHVLISQASIPQVVFSKPLRRAQMLPFFAKLTPCLIGMEACASAHYWARELMKLGHSVRLMPQRT